MKFTFGLDSKKDAVPTPFKLSHTENNAVELLSQRLHTVLSKIPQQKPIAIVCIGTDRSTGDSLGPLVGSHIKKQGIPRLHLFGTLDQPVHAMNLAETMESISQQLDSPYIVAVDACLGQMTSVGCIQLGEGPLKPGAGVNKDLPPVGHIHLTGIVNVGGFMEYFVLQNTRLNLVMNMAEVIANAIHLALVNKHRTLMGGIKMIE
jgi:putative sporulation protein YyaC